VAVLSSLLVVTVPPSDVTTVVLCDPQAAVPRIKIVAAIRAKCTGFT
jgi:hypothetical protein